jgi:hypothetical protein
MFDYTNLSLAAVQFHALRAIQGGLKPTDGPRFDDTAHYDYYSEFFGAASPCYSLTAIARKTQSDVETNSRNASPDQDNWVSVGMLMVLYTNGYALCYGDLDAAQADYDEIVQRVRGRSDSYGYELFLTEQHASEGDPYVLIVTTDAPHFDGFQGEVMRMLFQHNNPSMRTACVEQTSLGKLRYHFNEGAHSIRVHKRETFRPGER